MVKGKASLNTVADVVGVVEGFGYKKSEMARVVPCGNGGFSLALNGDTPLWMLCAELTIDQVAVVALKLADVRQYVERCTRANNS